MEVSDFLTSIKGDKFNLVKSFPFSLIYMKNFRKKYYIHTRAGVQTVGITVGKVYGYDQSLLPHTKPEKTTQNYLSLTQQFH